MTYMNKETELFKVVNVEMQDTLESYVKMDSSVVCSSALFFCRWDIYWKVGRFFAKLFEQFLI